GRMTASSEPDLKQLLLAYLVADDRYRVVEQWLVVQSIEGEASAEAKIRLDHLPTLAREREARRTEWVRALEEQLANGHRERGAVKEAIPIRGEDYPVLAAIWDNDDDAIYDEI